MTQSKFQAIEEFLLWLDNETYYEVGEDVQSNYDNGDSTFYRVSSKALLQKYKDACE